MTLSDIDLLGYGQFSAEPATFECRKRHLPAPWDYVYANRRLMLRMRHDGCCTIQADPPGGAVLVRQERDQVIPSMLVWVASGDERGPQAFTNYWLPTIPLQSPDVEPDDYSCVFAPHSADVRVAHAGWSLETRLHVPEDAPAVVVRVSLRNTGRRRRTATLIPVIKPRTAPVAMGDWQIMHWYQSASYFRAEGLQAFLFETRDHNGDPSKRLRSVMISDLAASSFEVAAGRFIGRGQWGAPEAVFARRLALDAARTAARYGRLAADQAIVGQPILGALCREVSLRPGEQFSFSFVFGELPKTDEGSAPPLREVRALAKHLMPEVARDEAARVGARYRVLFERRSIQTPDPRLNEYVNHWLPLQLDWVQVLDRGWATGMRGTRDAAQDARALAGIEPTLVRQRLCESLSLQRSDGWFLRQYSTAGRAGTHDSREYVDSGCWVWELLREYLYQTRDFQFLGIRLRWLDSDGRSSVLEHAVRLFEYYLDRENVGEHGLCKIREGDWNDSANRAGLEGRGESVMVSCQVVLGLREIAELLEHGPPLRIDLPRQRLAARYRARATKLSEALLRSALNRKGYFNALFADSGRWLFSPNDPDGQERVYGPANAFALIAGVVHGAKRDRVLEWLGSLKGPHGWRLFHPPIDPSHPVPSLGRLGQGDLLPGIAENGAPYNHGSHGFGGRAAWTCGKGELLYELLRYMLPYDQLAHPVEVAKTAPYAVVNHWREALGLEGSGGDTFLSGSIATALLNCYEGMVGFRPGLSCLTIDPCIPRSWRSMSASVPFLGGRLRIEIQNAPGVEAGVARVALDGHDLECLEWDSLLERYVARIPIKGIRKNRDHSAVVTMGAKRP